MGDKDRVDLLAGFIAGRMDSKEGVFQLVGVDREKMELIVRDHFDGYRYRIKFERTDD